MKSAARKLKRDGQVAKGALPDQPIQWSRKSTTYDFCPKCRIYDIWWVKHDSRWCPRCETLWTPSEVLAHKNGG